MFFINALYLFAASAVAGPVLFHLLLRDRPKRQILPTARFLLDSAPQSYAMHRLKNLMLMILRALVVALLVLAFARPFLGVGPKAATSASEMGAVFLVDTSLSMSAAERWNTARSRVSTLAQALPEGTVAALMLFDKGARLALSPTTDRAGLTAELQRVAPGPLAGDLPAAVQAASDLAAGIDARQRVVYVVSDFQKNGIADVSRVTAHPGVQLTPVTVADAAPANAAIVSAEITRSGTVDDATITATVGNFGVERLEGNLAVTRDGAALASVPVTVEAGQSARVTATVSLPRNEDAPIEIALGTQDAIAADNTYRLIAEARRAVPVLVVERTGSVVLGAESRGPPPGANAYLSAALSAMADTVTATWMDPDRLTAEELTAYPAVVLMGANVSARQIELLKGYVNLGGSLVVFPQREQTAGLAELGGAPVEGWGRAAGADEPYRLVTATLPQGPFALLDQSAQTVLGHPRAMRYLKCPATLPAGVTALARFDDGSPFLLERKDGDGLVYLFTVALDSSSTDFVLRAAFAPFMNELIAYAANTVRLPRTFVAGSRVPRRMTLEAPAATFGSPGFVSASVGKTVMPVAVNVDPVESDLAPADFIDVQALATRARAPEDPASALQTNLLEPEQERDHDAPLWKYCLMATLVLLGIESMLASRTTR